MTIDGYDGPITLGARSPSRTRGIHVDYTGTAPQSRHGINVPLAYTTAYTVFGLGCIVGAAHSRTTRARSAPLTVSAPEGVHPQCAEARAGVHPPRDRPDAARRGVRLPAPRPFPTACRPRARRACGTSSCAATTQGGDGRQLRLLAWRSPSNGGTGARPDKDGLSATAYPSGVRGTPVEIAESQTPLIFWRKELRPDSGGAGRTRGGLGPDHRDRKRHRRAVRAARRLRPHRLSGARPRRRARRRGGLRRRSKSGRAARARASSSCRRASGWSS